MNVQPFLDTTPIIQIHIIVALIGLFTGAIVLLRKKGDRLHKRAGRLFVGATAMTALTSFFIFTIRSIGPFSPIHLLSVLTLVSLIVGVRAAQAGHIATHQRAMKGIFWLAFVVTGLFTLLPGRIMHRILIEPTLADVMVLQHGASILANTPIWVWPLLSVLVAIGYFKTRPQTVTRLRLLPLPISFAIVAASGVLFSLQPSTMAAAVSVGAWIGFARGRSIAAKSSVTRMDGNRLTIPGEWLTMAILLIVFTTKFASAAVSGMTPDWADSHWLNGISGLVTGVALGLSSGRAFVYISLLAHNRKSDSLIDA